MMLYTQCIRAILLAIVAALFQGVTYAQFAGAVEDNSFFIEEAYNQDPRVVQHIMNGVYFSSPQKDLVLSFTQEWPAWSPDHQLSISIPYAFLNSGSVSGVGDILLNYRYQLFTGDDWAAVAPRFSVVLPTGSTEKGLGSGVVGMQVNLPVSKRLTDHLAAHVNAGVTIMPSVKGTDAGGAEVKRTLIVVNVGGSVIVLASAHLNVMLETMTNFLGEIGANGDIERSAETILSPGMAYGIDAGELQIVPGVAVPFVFSGGSHQTGAFFYLSFEHPF